ncbi:MAG: HAMP domain-containing sensor histidine kinase [Gemmatimonadaceae bacterium]
MSILNDAACGLLQTDANGRIHWANELFCTWIGRELAEIVGQRKLQDFFTVGGRIFHQTHWVPLMQMQHSVSEVKFEVMHSDGRTIPMVINGVRRERHGVIVHDLAAFIARDRDKYERELVSTGKKLNEMVTRLTELESAARDRAAFAEQMVAIVSHDLRNPLATIELSALTLLDGIEPSQLPTVHRITRATSRASRLIHDLLDFTQARMGNGLTVKRANLTLHDVLAESVDELRSAYPDRRIEYVSEGSGTCEADADRLSQLVGNLVTNAMTYGNTQTAVTVTSRISNGKCSVAVHNEGVPIAQDLVAQLFQPMARGANGPDESRSVGLGLYIVREIVKAHGGAVTVTSSEHEGTTFTVQFPCIRDNAV